MEGLIELNNFISADEEQTLLENIDKCAWNTSLSRRTQHYGYVYNYSKGGSLTSATAIPEWMDYLIERLSSHISQPINQAIINEYNPGQGIAPHIDAKTFGDTIVSISLGSKCIMEFTKDGEKIEKILNRQSCIVLNGASFSFSMDSSVLHIFILLHNAVNDFGILSSKQFLAIKCQMSVHPLL